MRRLTIAHLSSLLTVISLSFSAFATEPIGLNAKKTLGLQEGRYKVIQVDETHHNERVCLAGDIEEMAWFGDDMHPVLGMARTTFAHVNEGLIIDEKPYYVHGCKYSFSAQALEHRFISDIYSTGCDDGNKSTHTEIVVRGNLIEYSSSSKFSRDLKVVSVSSKCTFKKVETKP